MDYRSRQVPWNKLVPSKRNVRKVKSDPAPLAANIEADGLIHPLVVIERERGRYEVAAGERRRRAIGLLVKAGKWERTALVSVEVRGEDEATALSLAENVQRVAMHPADAFRAFAALASEGHDEAAIANRYGYQAAEVRRLLTLGQLSSRVLNALATDKIDVATARAFTLTNDHARQEAVLARCKTEREVRAMLTDTKVPTTSRTFTLIADAYAERGGSITRDLFAAEGDGYADDGALVAELVQGRFAELADEARAGGWGEVFADDRAPANIYSWSRMNPGDHRPLTPGEEAQIAEAQDAIATRRAELGKNVYYDATVSKHEAAIQRVRRGAEFYTAEQKAKGTLVICFDHTGGLDVIAYTKKAPQRASAANGKANTTADRPLFDAKMIEELSRVRTAALQYEVAHNDALARDVLLDRLLAMVAATGYTPPHAVQLRGADRLQSERSFEITAGKIASPAARVADVLATMPRDEGGRFAWVRALDDDTKTRLQSYCTAALIDGTEGKFADRPRLASAARIATAARLDMEEHWEPTIEFWARLSRRTLLATLTEAISPAAADNCIKMKKGELAVACMERVAGRGWLPPALRARPELEMAADDGDDFLTGGESDEEVEDRTEYAEEESATADTRELAEVD